MAKPKAEKPYNSGQWTVARKRSFQMSAIRRAAWPVKYEALKRAKLGYKIENPKTGRKCDAYECESCGAISIAKGVAVDHIIPIVPVTGFDSWDGVMERIHCELDGFQVLCNSCHKIKTAEENKQRKEHKKNETHRV